MRDFCAASRASKSWLPHEKRQYWQLGAGWDITVALACCMQRRKQIVKEHGGKFPASAEDLRALPGIGRYTAAAIASIAFDQPVAVVDGNVERVLQRVHGKNIAGEELWRAAGELLSQQRPGDFNQAMMELGATVCLPVQLPMSLMPSVRSLCDARRTAGG